MKGVTPAMDNYLSNLYYDVNKSSAAFTGVETLYHKIKKDSKYNISRYKLKKWPNASNKPLFDCFWE